MNNAKYFSLMDLARVDLMKRSGLLKVFSRNQWYPVVIAETAQFKKSIALFQSFDIETKILGWDEKAVLLEQTFVSGKTIHCQAVVRALFLRKARETNSKAVSTRELLEATKISGPSPDLPHWVELWNRAQSNRNHH